ncbi:KUP/HAK/KT family potassium transporter [Aromatoleum aromaticum]|uniref:Fragment of potassium transport system protein Kup2 n=1 Tax=Aromatoleum aromaticum (strain DSM 19018 / LMG 30748 / EbN1) TaxID=76114 RepID=Q5P464_AROAE|nr:hypothetical protein [Aromatoleum aromaticum]NMG53802.1 hypothetical protein [Aromatoleum aromaticum]CAI07899.1 fragment of potassium transport system protein Kup2 [Aromatoleum aromaticum EbN1]
MPYVTPAERLQLEQLDFGFWRLRVKYGFKDEPDIPAELARCRELGLKIDLMETNTVERDGREGRVRLPRGAARTGSTTGRAT